MQPNTKRLILKFVTYIIVNTFLMGLVLLIKQDITIRGFSDATFISGAVLFLFSVLKLLATKGAYDFIGYTFIRFRDLFRKDSVKSYPDAYSYVEQQSEKRIRDKEKMLAEFIVPGVFLIVAIILAFLA